MNEKLIRAYKAFGQNMRCRGFQFEVGQTYEHDGPVKACDSGFHACENPLDVWNYYPLDSRYAVVELGGEVSRHDSDSKIAAARITISAEIAMPQIVRDGIAYLMGLCKDAFDLAAPGSYSKLAALGDGSKLAASGSYSQLAASGSYSQLAASGSYSKLAASGNDSICIAAGLNAIARAGENGAIALTYHDGTRYRIAVGYVGENGIEPNVDYRVTNEGEFVNAHGNGWKDE